MLFKLARKSLWNRRTTALLTLLSLTVSIVLLLGIDHLRHQAKDSFSQTLSGTDLVVGARGGQLNLLLYSVFRMGNPTQNISWESYQELAAMRAVEWAVPLSLGDSHRGFRVLGTTGEYFERYRYGQRRALEFSHGEPFDGVYHAVLGAQVARQLGYDLGQEITLAHGTGSVSFMPHDGHPFIVVGILAPTGTPVDRTVHVSLEGIEAIHIGWEGGAPRPGRQVSPEEALQRDLTPESVTAVLVGLSSRAATFSVQRFINQYPQEALMAILPGVALTELWQMLSMVENLLYVISAMVLLAALIGMVTMLLASMKERQREIAVLRAVGAGRWYLFWLVELEALLLMAVAFALGALLLVVGLWVAQPWLAMQFGLFVDINPLGAHTAYLMLAVAALAALAGAVPAAVAYRRALAEGLTPRA
ncbi:FtsX-like permease family protein [Marinimicrobium sp. ABcell2]|uniref:ABC transporter permease n=1 Tax=Marinimicrobium sp. ABcell2 TaxID=3069751 RepID=UPI0027AE0788|nr:ABC transporter permease [Marinimicrobium sp. ABcell2]MDQ2076208.1 ABC transporter permease [Marinimicrobium sp. ABcell2]